MALLTTENSFFIYLTGLLLQHETSGKYHFQGAVTSSLDKSGVTRRFGRESSVFGQTFKFESDEAFSTDTGNWPKSATLKGTYDDHVHPFKHWPQPATAPVAFWDAGTEGKLCRFDCLAIDLEFETIGVTGAMTGQGSFFASSSIKTLGSLASATSDDHIVFRGKMFPRGNKNCRIVARACLKMNPNYSSSRPEIPTESSAGLSSVEVHEAFYSSELLGLNASNRLGIGRGKQVQDLAAKTGLKRNFNMISSRTTVPIPIITSWEFLGDNKIRVHWSLNVINPGIAVQMNLSVYPAQDTYESKDWGLDRNDQSARNGAWVPFVATDLLGNVSRYPLEIAVEFPVVTLFATDKIWMYSTAAFSCIIPNMVHGNYSVNVVVRNAMESDFNIPSSGIIESDSTEKRIRLDGGNINLDEQAFWLDNYLTGYSYQEMAEEFDTIAVTINTPPQPPAEISALVLKAPCINARDKEPTLEPFLTVSWSLTSRKKSHRWSSLPGDKPLAVEVQLETFDSHANQWMTFGEPTYVGTKELTSWNCTLVALPESNFANDLLSKFRVKAAVWNNFGRSSFIHSSEMSTLSVVVDEASGKANFTNCDDAYCVICGENVKYSEQFVPLSPALKAPVQTHSIRHEDECSANLTIPRALAPTLPFLAAAAAAYSSQAAADKKIAQILRKPRVLCGTLYLDPEFNTLVVTPCCCSHVFHMKCLLDWCSISRNRAENEFDEDRPLPKCPLCMQKFKYVVRQTLDPECLEERELLCARRTVVKNGNPPEQIHASWLPAGPTI